LRKKRRCPEGLASMETPSTSTSLGRSEMMSVPAAVRRSRSVWSVRRSRPEKAVASLLRPSSTVMPRSAARVKALT